MASYDHDLNELDYAISDSDAIQRHEEYKNLDPFPSIAPALLNSADIADYVSKTAMIYPFSPKKLKPASYEMPIGGEIIYWDEKNEIRHISEFKKGMEITFKKNSITFVTVNATFRLPNYIAIRFNLQIEHVHRGLLLGTGPLVNPGFRGQLMIPIHNLTNNDYIIESGYPLIGVEFTKLSPNQKSYSKLELDLSERRGIFRENSGNKDKKDFKKFFDTHLPIGISSVQASIASTLYETKATLNKADKRLNKNKKFMERFRSWSIFGAVVGIITLSGLFISTWSLISDSNKYVSDATMLFKDKPGKLYQFKGLSEISQMVEEEIGRSEEIIYAKQLGSIIKTQNNTLKNEISNLRLKITALENQIKNLKPPTDNLKPPTDTDEKN